VRVCVRARVHVCMCARMCACVRTCARGCVCMCARARMSVYVSPSLTYVRTHSLSRFRSLRACVCACNYLFVYYLCASEYVCVSIHSTFIPTHAHSLTHIEIQGHKRVVGSNAVTDSDKVAAGAAACVCVCECVCTHITFSLARKRGYAHNTLQHTATHCNTLQHTATH